MKDKYIFLGDSLTFGYGVRKKENWLSLLNESCNIEVINEGVNGNTTTDMLYRLSDVLTNPASNIFIMGGTNDLLSNRTIDSILLNIELIIKESLASGKKVVLGIPPDIIPGDANKLFIPSLTYNYCHDELPKLKDILIELCTKMNIPYINFYDITKNNKDNHIYLDGINFNPAGQKMLFNQSYSFFK